MRANDHTNNFIFVASLYHSLISSPPLRNEGNLEKISICMEPLLSFEVVVLLLKEGFQKAQCERMIGNLLS